MADDRPLPAASRGADAVRPLAQTFVSVSGLTVMADIGVNPEEIGAPQPLVLHVELTLVPGSGDQIDRTYDYRELVAHAETLAARRTGLIETFADDLARLCLAHPHVAAADVRVEKPQALVAGTAAARCLLRRPGF